MKLTLVINTNDLVVNLQIQSLGASRQRPENLNSSLTIYRPLGIKGRRSGDVLRDHAGDEVEDILVRLLEGEVDGESRERSKLGMKLKEEVSLICFQTDGIGLNNLC